MNTEITDNEIAAYLAAEAVTLTKLSVALGVNAAQKMGGTITEQRELTWPQSVQLLRTRRR